jgi:hypothetical protein
MQWKNELEELEEYISGLMEKKVTKTTDETQSAQCNYSPVTVGYVVQIKKSIRKVAFGFKKPKQRCVYIRRHQQVLIRLWNEVSTILEKATKENHVHPRLSGTPASGGHSPMETVHECLEELHGFLESEYADCFNANEIVPAAYLKKVQEELAIDFRKVLTAVIKRKVPKQLAAVIVNPYNAILEARPLQWNYQKIRWLKKFAEVVSSDSSEVPEVLQAETPGKRRKGRPTKRVKEFYTPVLQQLIYHDFNAIDFKNWLIQAIYEDVDELDSIYEKFERLSYHLKELGKQPVKEGSSYSLIARSVKDDVCDVIAKELKFFEDKYKLPLLSAVRLKEKGGEESPALTGIPLERGTSPATETGIHFGMPVPEIGLLFSLMQKAGLITNQNMKQLAAFLAEHCHSIGKDQFAVKNLYNAFSEKDKRTMESLDSKLMDVINLLHKKRRQ